MGNGAAGGAGGAGGMADVSAGVFNMSNTMTNVATNTAGITVVSQNSGIAAQVQQAVNVQANLNLGK